jgi:hypothetical protein
MYRDGLTKFDCESYDCADHSHMIMHAIDCPSDDAFMNNCKVRHRNYEAGPKNSMGLGTFVAENSAETNFDTEFRRRM